MEIARVTGGRYYTVSDSDIATKLMKDFEKLKKSKTEEKIYTQFEEKFSAPLILAGLMLLIESVISDRRKSKSVK